MITPATGPATTALEIVRGRQPGLRFPIGPGPIVLGNAPGPGPAIDLAPQEPDAPRRMSARHAQIERTPSGLLLRDLGSPGGTFVNRVRVERGQAIPLNLGDMIQLGPVQLRVVDGPAATAPPAPPPAHRPFVFTLKDGPACRSWDDFLAVSAQRWSSLRDELTSGRLSGFLAGIGRSDLVPDPDDPGSPDERLDAWIGRLPTTRPARPELEVHPRNLTVHASGGSGKVRRSLHVCNGGYRLLRTTARVEPPEASWLRVVGGPRPLVTVESSELVVEIDLPPSPGERRSASLVIEGNGGEARVPVTVGPAPERAGSPSTPATPRASAPGVALGRYSLATRVVVGAVGAGFLRLLLVAGDRVVPPSSPSPGLLGGAIVAGTLGALGGMAMAVRRGSVPDVPSAGFAGAIGGAMLAALAVATSRTLDALTSPSLPTSLAGVALAGAFLAGISAVLWPRTEATT